jgi:mRNA (guanine-N7-)-methyltransferase
MQDITYNEDTYYSRADNERYTVAMSKFHNYWVKSKSLIQKLPGCYSLFDMSCGKAGDLSKWVHAGLTTVVGVDISEDNILNQVDGAYTRLDDEKRLGFKSKYAFVPMDSSKPYLEQIDNISDAYMKNVAKTLWDTEDVKNPNIEHLRGLVSGPVFDAVSCQFSIHYFFKNEDTLDGFINNLNSVLKPGGYFVGTCFDGEKIDKLFSKDVDMVSGKCKDVTIWSIKKDYKKFKPDEYGQTIKVFVESINKTHEEYLVPFELLVKKLGDANIHLLTSEECQEMGVDSSEGMFSELFKKMMENNQEIVRSDKNKNNPIKIASTLPDNPDEMKFSFLNRWFIFRRGFSTKVENKKKTRKTAKK